MASSPSTLSRLLSALSRLALAERHRWPLWLPVALGTGAAGYFAMPREPSVALTVGLGAAAAGAMIAAGLSPQVWRRAALSAIAALLTGFVLAKLREERVAAPVLDRRIVTHLSGRIDAIDWRNAGVRLIVSDLRSGRFRDDAVPVRARIALAHGGEDFRPGDGVEMTALLAPPPGPAAPGDTDYARAAFFDSIGAAGFAYGKARPSPLGHAPGWGASLSLGIEKLRRTMTARIHAGLPGSAGGIAGALITGERGGIEPEDESALRDAGLAHVLAIAGLHMALVGLGLFWIVRAVLAAIPRLALRYPIKKWAAGAALLGAIFYLVISGGAASATRAFVMLATMLVAILLDRPALSMRALALAATILLVLRPEAITEPGFQMSFAAVAALIAVAEWEQSRLLHAGRGPGHGMVFRYARGIALTSLVGSLATLPFAIFHFGRATHYAVLGNLLAMPVMGFAVMPAAALSVAAMPFGLEAWPLALLGQGIALMLAIGHFVSGLPGAVSVLPAFPVAALATISLGGLWVAIWRRGWRWFGLLPVLAGIVLAICARGPDMLVAADGRTIAVRGDDGRLLFPRKPKDRYAASRWLQRDGETQDAQVGGAHCDGLGCVMRRNGLVIAAPLRAEALAEDCAHAGLVVAAIAAPHCDGPVLVLDAPALVQNGGVAIALTGAPQHVRMEEISVRDARGTRPWTVY